MPLEIITAFAALMQAVPSLAPLVQQLITWIGTQNGHDPGTAIANAGIAIDGLIKAKTEDEYAKAAKDIANMFAKPTGN